MILGLEDKVHMYTQFMLYGKEHWAVFEWIGDFSQVPLSTEMKKKLSPQIQQFCVFSMTKKFCIIRFVFLSGEKNIPLQSWRRPI